MTIQMPINRAVIPLNVVIAYDEAGSPSLVGASRVPVTLGEYASDLGDAKSAEIVAFKNLAEAIKWANRQADSRQSLPRALLPFLRVLTSYFD